MKKNKYIPETYTGRRFLTLLKESIVSSYNPKVDELVKFLSYCYDNMKYEENIDITKDVLKIVNVMKPEALSAAKDYKSKITFIKHKNKANILGQSSLYARDSKDDSKKEVEKINIEVFMDESKKELEFDESTRHELRHIIILLQASNSRKNDRKIIGNISKEKAKYGLNMLKIEQAISAFVDMFKRNISNVNRPYLSYESLLNTIFYQYNFTDKIVRNKIFSDNFRTYLKRRLYREGIIFEIKENKICLMRRDK